MIHIKKFIICFICLTLLSSCGFFERKALDEKKIRSYIFPQGILDEMNMNVYSKGAVGGYSFVVKVRVASQSDVTPESLGYEKINEYSSDDPNRELLINLFNSSIQNYFSGVQVPEWVSENVCSSTVARYKKVESKLVVVLYKGVGKCDELYFFGSLD